LCYTTVRLDGQWVLNGEEVGDNVPNQDTPWRMILPDSQGLLRIPEKCTHAVNKQIALLLLFLVSLIGLVFLYIDPVAQPKQYLQFADQRMLFGIKNFLNVVSNLPLILLGICGVVLMWRKQLVHDNLSVTPAYLTLFAAVIFTGIGSIWFHLNPTNGTLFWDRLPMAVVFMALTAALVAEYLGRRLQKILFYPLLLAGAGSVIYWHITETLGRGDLRPYLLVQFLPIICIVLLMTISQSRFTRSRDIPVILLCYGLAKLTEFLDQQIFAATTVISGHTLKHLLAAAAILILLRMLWLREQIVN